MNKQANKLISEINPTFNLEYHKFISETKRYDIKCAQRTRVINRIHELAMEKLLTEGYNIRIPGIGVLALSKERGLAVDRYQSKLLRKKVYHSNIHTLGYIYKVRFFTHQGSIPFLRFYKFCTAFKIKDRMKDYIFNNEISPI